MIETLKHALEVSISNIDIISVVIALWWSGKKLIEALRWVRDRMRTSK